MLCFIIFLFLLFGVVVVASSSQEVTGDNGLLPEIPGRSGT